MTSSLVCTSRKLAGQTGFAYHKIEAQGGSSLGSSESYRVLPPPASSRLLLGPSAAKEKPLNHSIRQITTFGVAALIALRLGVGWHFFKEGVAKFTGDGFTSVYFLQQAKGPLSDLYKDMIPDREGRKRLDRAETEQFWRDYMNAAVKRYKLNEQQAEQVYKEYQAKLKLFFDEHGADIREYLLECDRLEQAKQEPIRTVEFRREWINEKEAELRGKAAPWLADLKMLGQQFQNALHAQAGDVKVYPIPDRSAMIVDTLVKYTVLIVGILLILGLFTRLASLVGIGFLLSVMSTQPPWVPGAETTYSYYQLVEVLALVVIIATAAGYFGGLDYIIRGLRLRRHMPEKIDL